MPACPHSKDVMCLACVHALSTARRRAKQVEFAREAALVRLSTLDYEDRLCRSGGPRAVAYGRREASPGPLRPEGPWVDSFGHARDTHGHELCFDEEG